MVKCFIFPSALYIKPFATGKSLFFSWVMASNKEKKKTEKIRPIKNFNTFLLNIA